jgi:hypothetical protein
MTVANPQIDHAKSVDLNIVVRTPHVVAYKLWRWEPITGPWHACGAGSAPCHVTLDPLSAGAKVAFCVQVSGHPNDPYSIEMTFAQDGKNVSDGVVHETGTTNGDGVAVAEEEVAFP